MQLWEKISLISALVIVIAFVVVLSVFGNRYIQASTDKEIRLRLFEFAIDSLREEPTQNNKHIRTWAVRLINSYAGVRLNTTTQKQLIEKFSATQIRQVEDTSIKQLKTLKK